MRKVNQRTANCVAGNQFLAITELQDHGQQLSRLLNNNYCCLLWSSEIKKIWWHFPDDTWPFPDNDSIALPLVRQVSVILNSLNSECMKSFEITHPNYQKLSLFGVPNVPEEHTWAFYPKCLLIPPQIPLPPTELNQF